MLIRSMLKVQFAMEQYNLFQYKHNHTEVSTKKVNTVILRNKNNVMGLYHPPDGVTNLKYKLLCFLTPNEIIF